jgi:hypothetical protein
VGTTSTTANPALRTGWVVVALLVILLATIPLAAEVADRRQAVLAEAVVLVCYAGIVRSVVSGAKIAQILFWTFCASWLALAPLYQLAVQRVAWRDRSVLTHDDSVITAQVLLLLGLLAFLAGSMFVGSKHERRRELKIEYDRLTRCVLVLVAIGLVLLPVVIASSGGLEQLFASRSERSSSLGSSGALDIAGGRGVGLGLLVLLPAAGATTAAYFALRGLRNEARHRTFLNWRVSWLVSVTAGVLLVAIVANPFANTRFISIAAIGCCFLAVVRPTQPRQGIIVALVMIGAFLFVYPLANVFRSAGEAKNVKLFALDDWTSEDFDGFQQWINTVLYVQDHGHTDGKFILSAILFPVPRALWSAKEIPASFPVAEYRGYAFTNLSLPFTAELYLEFGTAGMVLIMVAMGWAWQRLDEAWLHTPDSVLGALVPLVATQQLGLIRGPLGAQVPMVGAVLGLSLATILFARNGARTRTAGEVWVR